MTDQVLSNLGTEFFIVVAMKPLRIRIFLLAPL